MKEPSQVFVEINLVKALTSTKHKIPFLRSAGNVILSEGTIPLEYVRSVVDWVSKKYVY